MTDIQTTEDENSQAEIADQLPQPHIIAMEDWCFRNAGSTCTRCTQACPQAAISFSENDMPVIDPLRCSECGICLGICDNFTDDRLRTEDIPERIAYLSNNYDAAYLCCEETLFPGFHPAHNVLVLPCLASIPPELWVLLLEKDVEFRLYFDEASCNNCLRAAPMGRPLFEYAARHAESLTGKTIQFVDELPEKENIASEFIKSGNFERRGIISGTLSSVSDLASGEYSRRTTDTALDALIHRERMRAEGRVRNGDRTEHVPGAFVSRIAPPKRELIRELANINPDLAKSLPRIVSATNERMCDNCAGPSGKNFDCIDVCPTHARRRVFGKDMLDFSEDFCIGCGLCVPSCPNHAITLIQKSIASS